MKEETPLLKRFLKKLSNNNLLLFLSLLTIIHVIILTLYFQQTTGTLHTKFKNNINYTVLRLVLNASQNLPIENLQAMANQISDYKLQLNNYRIHISLDPRPRWNLQFKKDTDLTRIITTLDSTTLPVRLSYQLSNKVWLNYSEHAVATSYNIAALLILMELSIIGLVLFYNFSLQRFTIPLQNFKRSAERLGIDVNATPIQVYGTALVRETANAMNKMQQRLQDLINTRTKMLATISHDLRTPITRLKLRAYLIGNEEQAKKMIADLDEMETMINSILTFAREDYTHNKKIHFDINSLLASLCDDYTDEMFPVHANLLDHRLPYLGRPLVLKRAINNLIQNALKYAGAAWIYLKYDNEKIMITIEDNGPGIPAEELPKVFRAYYRSKHAAAGSSMGSGLGLTIAYEIIHSHNGTIELRNRKKQSGLQVVITLPRNVV